MKQFKRKSHKLSKSGTQHAGCKELS